MFTKGNNFNISFFILYDIIYSDEQVIKMDINELKRELESYKIKINDLWRSL